MVQDGFGHGRFKLAPTGQGDPGSTGPIRSSTTSVSARFRQIHIRHLGESVPGVGRNTKIDSAPLFSGSRSGDEVPRLVMRISARGPPKRPLPMCGTPRTQSSRTPCESISMSNSTPVAPTSSASDGNAGLSRFLGTQGPDRRAWVAEVSVLERKLACQTQLAPDPLPDPVPQAVGFGLGCVGGVWLASRGLRIRAALTWCPLALGHR